MMAALHEQKNSNIKQVGLKSPPQIQWLQKAKIEDCLAKVVKGTSSNVPAHWCR